MTDSPVYIEPGCTYANGRCGGCVRGADGNCGACEAYAGSEVMCGGTCLGDVTTIACGRLGGSYDGFVCVRDSISGRVFIAENVGFDESPSLSSAPLEACGAPLSLPSCAPR